MAPKCYICKYYDPKKMSLFRIPNRSDEYSERGKVWLKLLNASNENVNNIRICSQHFLKKQPSKDDNYLDVDWVPNRNLGEYSKNWKSVEYYIRKKNASRNFLFDQRGARKSTPAFCLEKNDTWSLVEDMEKLRTHLGVNQWILFGGSWGSTLSLAYAEKHIDRVLGMILRGIFTLRDEEIHWFYQSGASFIFPDVWEQYVAPIPENERGDFVTSPFRQNCVSNY